MPISKAKRERQRANRRKGKGFLTSAAVDNIDKSYNFNVSNSFNNIADFSVRVPGCACGNFR